MTSSPSSAALLGLALALAACAPGSDYLARSDQVVPQAGDAAASARAIQGIDPWPAYAGDTAIATDGEVAASAIERYRKGETRESSAAVATTNAAVVPVQ